METERRVSTYWLLTQTGVVDPPDITGSHAVLILGQVVALDTIEGEEDVARFAAAPVASRDVGTVVITASSVVHTLVNICQQDGS